MGCHMGGQGDAPGKGSRGCDNTSLPLSLKKKKKKRKHLELGGTIKKKINCIFGKKIGFPIGHIQPSV